MTSTSRSTLELLDAWHGGDQTALVELVQRHAPWLRSYVRRQMTQPLRGFETSEDVVQTVLYNLLRFGPSFRPQDEAQFRGLIARSVLNRLSDLHDYASAEMRDRGREQPLPTAISRIGKGASSSAAPERVSELAEERSFVALALQLVEPEHRRIVLWREFQELPFAEIGAKLSISEDAARHRFNQALERLGEQVRRLKLGQLEGLVKDLE